MRRVSYQEDVAGAEVVSDLRGERERGNSLDLDGQARNSGGASDQVAESLVGVVRERLGLRRPFEPVPPPIVGAGR